MFTGTIEHMEHSEKIERPPVRRPGSYVGPWEYGYIEEYDNVGHEGKHTVTFKALLRAEVTAGTEWEASKIAREQLEKDLSKLGKYPDFVPSEETPKFEAGGVIAEPDATIRLQPGERLIKIRAADVKKIVDALTPESLIERISKNTEAEPYVEKLVAVNGDGVRVIQIDNGLFSVNVAPLCWKNVEAVDHYEAGRKAVAEYEAHAGSVPSVRNIVINDVEAPTVGTADANYLLGQSDG